MANSAKSLLMSTKDSLSEVTLMNSLSGVLQDQSLDGKLSEFGQSMNLTLLSE